MSSEIRRPSGRAPDQSREIRITRDYTRHAEGSVLVEFGDTKVLCNASVEAGVPQMIQMSGVNAGRGESHYLRTRGEGEARVREADGDGRLVGTILRASTIFGPDDSFLNRFAGLLKISPVLPLPRATHTRGSREATRGKQGGRTLEIQRLIGRSLRAAVNLKKLGEFTITVDCDVIQADGGTRTASITGGCVALIDAIRYLQREKQIKGDPFHQLVSSVSVGLFKGMPVVDLDYPEDSSADTDMNVVMAEGSGLIEVQGTAEAGTFSRAELDAMLDLAEKAGGELFAHQREALGIRG